ncbi:hypothetical protein MICRO8M_130026 [Microbacterium sp. 8M]|nr:hypothetical protein MICRO8M_130026 [Microbacterium sp. 8M]
MVSASASPWARTPVQGIVDRPSAGVRRHPGPHWMEQRCPSTAELPHTRPRDEPRPLVPPGC